MGRINTLPYGLQSLLGNTNFGDNPSDLSQVTAPVIGLDHNFEAFRIDYARNTGSINSSGDFVATVIPAGEAWIPIAIAPTLNGEVAGDIAKINVEIWEAPGLPFAGSVGQPIGAGRLELESAGAEATYVTAPPWRFILQPGTEIRAVVDDFVSAGGTGTKSLALRTMYVKLEV